MTQAAFAAEMGVSRKWLSEVENGKQTVELGLVLAVFRRLGLDLVAAERPRPPVRLRRCFAIPRQPARLATP